MSKVANITFKDFKYHTMRNNPKFVFIFNFNIQYSTFDYFKKTHKLYKGKSDFCLMGKFFQGEMPIIGVSLLGRKP